MNGFDPLLEQPPIHVVMAQVMRDVPHVGKEGFNEGQGFRFRGIDSLLNHIGPVLRQHGVVVRPEVLEVDQGAHFVEQAGNGNKAGYTKVTYWARVKVCYHFVGPAGDSFDVVMAGEALDQYDKSTTKALSQAYKYALVQMLALPTDEPDADGQNPGQPELERENTRSRTTQRAPRQERSRPPKKVNGLDADALRLAMDDIVDDAQRKKVKGEFVKNFAKPDDLTADLLDAAWEFLREALDMEPHEYLDDTTGSATCSLCGTLVRARWHLKPETGRTSPENGPSDSRATESSEAPSQDQGPQGGDVTTSSGPLYPPEWIGAASKSALVAACASLALDESGTVADLRARLTEATGLA